MNLLSIPTQVFITETPGFMVFVFLHFPFKRIIGFFFPRGVVFFLEENLSYLKYSLGTLLEFDNYQAL